MILQKIISDVKFRLEEQKRSLPLVELKEMIAEQPAALKLTSVIAGGGVKLIAEVKKASPSAGIIRADFNPLETARIYTEGGVAAISVLTETDNFHGRLEYIKDIKAALKGRNIPLLRKDFIIDPYQVYQSRAYGADCLLLIVAILEPDKLAYLLSLSHEMGMRCLVEAHSEDELALALESGAEIIGINNRDLDTFIVDINTTKRLKALIPMDRLTVSESGIKNRRDMQKLDDWGIDAALVGEALMAAPDIAAGMRELL
ncbi:indole-3-glycerol phosphate synthase TrpC [Chloroflexota bacterium]